MSYLALAGMVILTTFGMIFIKNGSKRVVAGEGLAKAVRSALNTHTISGMVASVAAPALYLLALARLPLNTAFAFTGLNYVFVFLSGWLFFKERISLFHMLGILAIAGGIVFINL